MIAAQSGTWGRVFDACMRYRCGLGIDRDVAWSRQLRAAIYGCKLVNITHFIERLCRSVVLKPKYLGL